MPSYNVSIGEREYNVQVLDKQVLLNGEPVNFDMVTLNGNGLHLVREGNQSREVYLGTHTSGVYEVISGGRRVIARVNHANRRPLRTMEKQVAGHILAPMPGLVVEMMVKEGEFVSEGQVLAVQEAMKMQMQLKAPFTGRIEHIAARAGMQVAKDELILRMTDDEH